MKRTFYTATISYLLCLMMFLPGCKKVDPCKGRECGQFGSCVVMGAEGECQCEEGFLKNSQGLCEIFSVTQYAGTFQALDTCTNHFTGDKMYGDYELEIEILSSTEIRLSNLGSFSCMGGPLQVDATVENNEILLQKGTYCVDMGAGTEYEINSGKGSISTAGIKFTYGLDFIQSGTVTLSEGCSLSLVRK